MLYMIAQIYNRASLIGFTIYDTERYEYKHLNYDFILNRMTLGIKIENLQIINNTIKGYGGDLSRYTIVNKNGVPLNGISYTVIGVKKEDTGKITYCLVDFIGRRYYITAEELDNMHDVLRITNGKIVKSKNRYYISSISGNIPVIEDKNAIEVINTKTISGYIPKYKIPDRATHLSSYMKRNNVSLYNEENIKKISMIRWCDLKEPRKYVTSRKGYLFPDGSGKFMHERLYAYMDVMRTIDINILEVNINKQIKFILNISYTSYLVDDILYTGNKWKSISNTTDESDVKNGSSVIIALGQLGVLVISIKDGVSSYSSKAVLTSIIPYSLIGETFDIRDILIKLGDLDTDDLNRIYEKVENPNVKSIEVNKFSSIGVESEIVASNDGYVNKNQGVIAVQTINSSGNTHKARIMSKCMDIEFMELLQNEVNIISSMKNYAIVIDGIRSIIVRAPKVYFSIVKSSTEPSYVLNHHNIKLEYIGFIALSKLGIIGDMPRDLVNVDDIKIIEDAIYHISKDGNSVSIYMERYRVVYDIGILLKLYNDTCKYIDEQRIKSTKYMNKQMILGANVKVNDLGFICDWEENSRIDTSSSTVGIEINSLNARKRVIINVCTPIKILDNRDMTYERSKLILSFRNGSIIHLLNLINEFNIEKGGFKLLDIQIDCADLTYPELLQVISMKMRSFGSNYFRVKNKDGEYKTEILGIKSFEYNIYFIISNLLHLYRQSKNMSGILSGCYDRASDSIFLVNIDKIPEDVKKQLIKNCYSAANGRRGNKTFQYEYIEYIIKLIATDDNEIRQLKELRNM